MPNEELAKSTGPFGLAYAHMFNPTIGSIVMGLAVIACLGSLLGWQFTIATDREIRGGRADVPRLLLEGEQAGSADHRHDRAGRRAVACWR